MLEKLQMYINGEWVDSHSTETIEVMNPSDDSVLGVITAGNSDDVDKALSTSSELPAVITPRTESSDGFMTSIVSVE